jgi:glycosyltransferase involved in cell wall biosynthesis
MPRVLFVTPSLAYGGAERHAVTLMCRLAERGHECHAAYVKDLEPNQSVEVRARLGDRVSCLDASRYFDRRALAALAARVAQIRPDAVVAANPYALMYASLALRRARMRTPLVVTYHSTRILGAKERLKMIFYLPFFWSADCAIFVAEKQKQHSLRRAVFARHNQVIHNGVDTTRFSNHFSAVQRAAVRRALGFSEQDYLIVIVALLRPEKNHLQLVDAVAALRKRGIAACALMVGDGETRAAVEARARARGVERAVVITGFRPEVRPYIAASDVFALCSVTEAFSLAAIEAMALAKPVVHPDVGGAAEMIFPGRNGFLFPVGDTQGFVDKLAILADREVAETMGQRAREIVQALFSEQMMVDRYEQTLLGLCRKQPTAGSSPGLPTRPHFPH